MSYFHLVVHSIVVVILREVNTLFTLSLHNYIMERGLVGQGVSKLHNRERFHVLARAAEHS